MTRHLKRIDNKVPSEPYRNQGVCRSLSWSWKSLPLARITFIRCAISFANLMLMGVWQNERVEAQLRRVRLIMCCAYSDKSNWSRDATRFTRTSSARGVARLRWFIILGPVVAIMKLLGESVTHVPRGAEPSPR